MARSSWAALGLLVAMIASSSVQASSGSSGKKVPPVDPQIEVLTKLKGHARAIKSADLSHLYRSTLDVDWAMFPENFNNITAFEELVAKIASNTTHVNPKYVALVVLKNNKVHYMWLEGKGMPNGLNYRFPCFSGALQDLAKKGEKLPNTMFIYNVHDHPMCRVQNYCTSPVFSHYKVWSEDTNERRDTDILIPIFNQNLDKLYKYDWGKKQNAAVFRGRGKCGFMTPRCSREDVWDLSKQMPDLLNVGITDNSISKQMEDGNFRQLREIPKAEQADHISVPNHAKWKYTLNMEGPVGSPRLWQLMSLNSVVLREKSVWTDALTRATKNGVHYIEWRDDNGTLDTLVYTVKLLQANDDLAFEIAANAHQFVYKYKSKLSSAVFAKAAINEYARRWGSVMEAEVDKLELRGGKEVVDETLRQYILGVKAKYLPECEPEKWGCKLRPEPENTFPWARRLARRLTADRVAGRITGQVQL